jgi:hypothetical protein
MMFGEHYPVLPDQELFTTGDLLSKWGFHDGDQLDWLWEHGRFNRHQVLLEVVKRHILPALAQKVEVTLISSGHNGVRATTVDGIDVRDCWYGDKEGPELFPEHVIVRGEEILAIAKEIAAV